VDAGPGACDLEMSSGGAALAAAGECRGGLCAVCAGGVEPIGDAEDDEIGGVEFGMLGAAELGCGLGVAGLGCGGVTRRGAAVVGRITVSSDTVAEPAIVGAGCGGAERKGNCVSPKTT
jgi:hypothetical protein